MLLAAAKTIYYKLRILQYKFRARKLAILEKGVVIDRNTSFSGRNRVSQNSRLINSSVGYATYFGRNVDISNTEIGKFSCIGPNTQVIRGQHPMDFVSIHPAFYSVRKQSDFTFVNKQVFNEYKFVDPANKISVKIGSDVWIASDCKIIEGVTIGDGAIILPGAVINKDVPPYAIVGGVPAKIIRYRFDQDTIDWLMALKWWDKSEAWKIKYAPYFADPKKLRELLESEKHS